MKPALVTVAPLLVVAALIGAMFVARRRGYKLGGNTVVRCRRGHLFTTIWVPGIKIKALDLGIARLQRCSVGKHLSLVTPVRDSDLTRNASSLAHTTTYASPDPLRVFAFGQY